MIINSESLTRLFTGFKAAFNQGLEGAPTFYSKVTMKTVSTTGEEEYGWIGKFPSIREWIGDRVVQNLSTSGFKLKNRDFEATLSVERNKIADDQFGVYAPIFREMGRETAEHPDRLVSELIGGGFNNACYDGQYFFDADHPVVDEKGATSSVSNYTAGSGPAWYLIDASRAIGAFIYQERQPYRFTSLDKETDENVFFRKEYIYGVHGRSNAGYGLWQLAHASKQALTPDSFGDARTAMTSLRGDGGRRLGIKPTILLVPTELEGAGRKVINNALAAGGESNEWAGSAELVVSPWL